MKPLQIVTLALVLIAATCLPGQAWHRHGGVWVVGPGWVGAYPYPYPYYYTVPQRIVIERQPELYIQQAPLPAPEPSYWYYCPNPQGYYPYIKECLTPWMKVVPTPPDGTSVKPQQPAP